MARRTRSQWWLFQTSGRRRSATRKRSVIPFSRRLRIEPLEDRRLLTITVNTLIDVNASDGLTTLREAIAAAPAGETINFAASLTTGGPATIQLTNVGHAGEILINKSLTILGPGANLLTIGAHAGTAAAGDGSRIFNIDDGTASHFVYIEGLTFSGGDVNGKGGAIFSSETLAIFASVFSNNATSDVNGNSGGAIYSNNAGLGVDNSTFSNNHAGDGGGAIFSFGAGATTTIVGSTLSGNTARFSGGAIFKQQGTMTLSNSTLSGNSAGYAGGGLLNQIGTATLRHVTITGNSAPNGWGSGIASVSQSDILASKTFTELYSTIVSANGVNNDDVAVILGLSNSFISLGENLIGGGNANSVFFERDVFNPLLGPLADNGGPTRTHALLAGSPAINRIDATGVVVPTTDQRGTGFPRVFGDRMDIGAYEFQAPNAVVVDTVADEDDGNYGAGDLSLREALRFADVITFALPPGSIILLIQGELKISGSVSIQGPGATNLIIDASGNDPDAPAKNGNGSRVFNVDDGSVVDRSVFISGLTLTGGDTGVSGGGAVLNQESLTITGCRIINNSTTGNGGGIANDGHLKVAGSTISLNSATVVSRGGGIYTAVDCIVTDSTINGNYSQNYGGGIANAPGGALYLINSTVSANTVGYRGSGVYSVAGSFFSVINCTFLDEIFSVTDGDEPSTITMVNTIHDDVYGNVPPNHNIGSVALGPLQDNGGPTFTHALPAGSPAIDAGNPAHFQPGVGGVPLYDQRGAPYTRVYNGRIDIGAYEVQPTVAGPALPGDYNQNNVVDTADYTMWIDSYGTNGVPYSGADGSGNGAVGMEDYDIWKANFGETLAGAGSGSVEDPHPLVTNRPDRFPSRPLPEGEAIDAALAEPVAPKEVPAGVVLGTLGRAANDARPNTAGQVRHGESSTRPWHRAATRQDAALAAWLALRSGGDKKERGIDAADLMSGSASEAATPASFDALDAAFNGWELLVA